MSALTEKVAREHRATPYDSDGRRWSCTCGVITDHGKARERHITEVTEAATRAAVVADIEDLEHTSQQVTDGVRRGRTVEYYEGYEQAVVHAARIAEGEQ